MHLAQCSHNCRFVDTITNVLNSAVEALAHLSKSLEMQALQGFVHKA